MILQAHVDAPCDVFDANGEQLLYAVWCDTETGEAVHLVKDGKEFVIETDENGEAIAKTVRLQHPAPLTFVRRGRCATQPR